MGTARHRARKRRPTELIASVAGVVGVAVVSAVVLTSGSGTSESNDDAGGVADTVEADVPCSTTVRIVTATSFEPVLRGVEPLVGSGDACARLEIELADGRSADERVAELNADLWIADDAAWAGIPNSADLDPDAAGAGTHVATSPIYMVTDGATADQLAAVDESWRTLPQLVTNQDDIDLVIRDPASSGDGLVAAGSLGEGVWLDQGMDASAAALVAALPSTRTVHEHAVPSEDGEIGLVPEYVLAALLAEDDNPWLQEAAIISGTDYSAMLRYTWLPTTTAAESPAVVAAMERLLSVLTGPEAEEALAAAGLRRPDGTLPAGMTDEFPGPEGEPFAVLERHRVEHVFATWYAEDRLADVLVAIDVSGSMAEPVAGSETPLIDFVRDGVGSLAELLPDESELSLWQFGVQLDPPRDHVELVPRQPLDSGHRESLSAALRSLSALDTGTGLYDTMLAAYLDAQENYQEGRPNRVIMFTDGRNEDDPDSLTAAELTEELAAAHDPERPVQLTMITFGPEPDTELLADILEPVDSYIAPLTAAADVRAVFLHLAAGGVHR
ncbi:MAG: VWA domain-containing protein [Actinomycetota bacterium]